MPLISLDFKLVRSALFILVWALLACLSPGQSRRFQEEWRWARFGLEDGLPSLRIEAITQSKDGTLWVQTGKGPAWFDGFRWNPVPIEVSSSLDTRRPICALGDTGILVQTQVTNLLRVEKTGASALALPHRFRKHVIMDVLGDDDGGFYLILFRADSGEGIRFLFHDGTEVKEFVLPEDLSRSKGVRLVLGSGREVFLVTDTQTWAWVDGRFKAPVVLPEPGWHVKNIGSDGQGAIGRVISTRVSEDERQTPTRMTGQRRGTQETALWERAADAGYLRREWIQSRGLVGAADLSSRRSIVVLQGRECQFLESGKWKTLDPLPSNFLGASSLFWTRDGRLCVGTVRGLSICQYESALWAKSEIDDLDSGKIRKVIGDRAGTLWVLGDKGLFSFPRDRSPGRSHMRKGKTHGWIATDLIQDGQDRLWAIDRSGGIYKRVDGRWSVLEGEETVPELVSASFLGEDSQGPWVQAESRTAGLPKGRLLRWTGKRFEDWQPWEQSVYGLFHDMVSDTKGTLWFAGEQGISRYKDGQWEHWNRDRGLIRNHVDSIALDGNGRLWFLHAGVALGSLSASGEVSYANHSGLPDYDCPRSLERGVDGRLWAHTDTRLRLLPVDKDPDRASMAMESRGAADWVDIDFPPGWAQQNYVQMHPTKDSLFFLNSDGDLSSFSIGVGDSPPPVLELGRPRVHVGGISMSWVARSWYGAIPAARVLTRHRMDEDAWSDWGTGHRFDLWNLEPGPHRVHVQARNRLGREGMTFVTGVVQIPAPFWMGPAFYLPISALVSLLLVTLLLWGMNSKRYARILEASQNKLVTMAEISPVGILHADDRGEIQFRNQRGDEIVGMQLSGRLPQDYLGAIHGADRLRVRREWVAAARSGVRFESRFRFCHDDGSTRWVMGQVVPEQDEKGRVIAYVGTLTDITEMETAALERKRLEERLVQAQKLESVGQLAGGIAHDFNNLLQVILGYTDFLDERLRVDGFEDPDLAQIKYSAERATELTRQLLAFSRKQQGRPRPLNPVKAIEEVLAMICRILPENMSIEFQPLEGIGTICMDGNQFEQVLLNLCLNARDAMPDGGLLKISVENVEILSSEDQPGTVAAPGRYVLLRVLDTGTGMSEMVSKRLFEPFFTTKEPGKGTGLGMAMVYGIVRQNEGAVEVESELGEGTELRIYFPRIEGQLEVGVEMAIEEQGGGGETILIAEDEELVRNLAQTMLERAGYRVLTAVDGEDAIQVFQENQNEISVVLLDAIMPRCGGREVYEHLRKMDANVAFLFSSGHPANQLPGTFLEENRLVLIPKPYKAKQLLKEVRGVLERQNRKG